MPLPSYAGLTRHAPVLPVSHVNRASLPHMPETPARGNAIRRLPYDPITGKRTEYEPTFRSVRTEVQRRTAGGGYTSIAIAENPDWADTLARAMNWIVDGGGDDPETKFGRQ